MAREHRILTGHAPTAGCLSGAARRLAALLLSSLVIAAQAGPVIDGEGVKLVLHGTAHDALYDLAFEGRDGIAVGAFGAIVTTADGGATWTRQSPTPTELALFGVARREGRCVAVGQTGLTLAAQDCRQWKASRSVSQSRLISVSLNSTGQAFAVGAFGTILRSSDWGQTWTSVPMDWSRITAEGAEPHLYGVHVGDEGTVTAVGEFELVLRSTDGGARWNVLHKGEKSLFGLLILDGGQIYAVGQDGAVLSSPDGGASWRALDTGVTAILTGVLALPTGTVMATGINTIIYSRDGGASWSALQSKLVKNAWHETLAASEDPSGNQRIVSVGAGGMILELSQKTNIKEGS